MYNYGCYYTKHERKVMKRRKRLCHRSNVLLVGSFICALLLSGADATQELPWWILIVGAIFGLAGLAGHIFLEITGTTYTRFSDGKEWYL